MSYFVRNGERVTAAINTGSVVVPYGNLIVWRDSGQTAELTKYGVTVAEDPPPPPPVIDDATVRYECKRRIYAAASEATQSNMNGYINLLNCKALAGQSLSAQEVADIGLFGQAMAWIVAMRSAVPGLIGKADYADDKNWPALSGDLKAFAARF